MSDQDKPANVEPQAGHESALRNRPAKLPPGAPARPAADVEGNTAQAAPPVPTGRPGPGVIAVQHGMFGVPGSGDTSGYGELTATVTMPGPSAKPYGGWFDDFTQILADVLTEQSGPSYEEAVEAVVVDRGELTLHVRRQHLPAVARALRDDQDLRFEICMGVNGAHYPLEAGRELHAVYPLRSLTHNRRIRVEVACPETDPHIPSVTGLYPGNDWHERETWDFFGIIFDGHPALTRIEMPDDWLGHPQRKDYPLGGIPVEYKGATIPPPDTRRQYR